MRQSKPASVLPRSAPDGRDPGGGRELSGMRILRIGALAAVLLSAGCTWVPEAPGASAVRVATPGEVADCDFLATTRTSVRDRVAGIQRTPGKVAGEIERLARVSALELAGDTLVPRGPVREGAREFAVYRCHGDRD